MTRTALIVLGLVLIAGCNQSPPGGPGASSKPPVVGMADNTFRLDAPVMETAVKQGETKMLTVGVTRGKNFDQDINIVLDSTPKGLTITPGQTALKASEKQVTITIEAAKDAALGHHTFTVNGTPSHDGAKTSVDVKVEVKGS